MATPKQVMEAAFAERGTTRTIAREIMGDNCIDIDDVVNGLSLIIPTSLQAIFETVPWTRETLESVKETHVLVAVLPFSIMDLWRMLGSELFCDCQGEEWFKGKRYAEVHEAPAWHLVRKDAVPNSASRSWAEQQALLGEEETVPSARVIVSTVVSHYLRHGETMFQNIYARCSDEDGEGGHVSVAVLHRTQIHTEHWTDETRLMQIGLATERMPMAA